MADARSCSTASARFRCGAGQADVEAIETAVRLAREGHVVDDVPGGDAAAEGAREAPRGAAAQSGAARIALEAGVPLVPAAVAGTDRLLRLGPLRVAYGPPVEIDDLRGTRATCATPRRRRPSG